MQTTFTKYLLNEAHFGATAKKGVISTIQGYLESMKKGSMKIIRDKLEHVDRVNDYDEIGDAIEKEITRLNKEYISEFTEWVNTRRWK